MDAFHIIASVGCDNTWKMCTDRHIYASYVTQVIFYVVRITYLGAETLLCISLHRSTFSDRSSTRYGLMFLQAVNFSLWFDALIHESAQLFDASHARREDFNQRCLANVSNVSTDMLNCLHHNNTIYWLLDEFVNPTFFPFTIEFTLLVGECVFQWYYHCSALVKSQRSTEDRVDQITSSNATMTESSGSDGQLLFEEDLPNGVERESDSSSNSISSDLLPVVESSPGYPSRTERFLSFIVFSVTIGLNAPFCFLVIRQMYAKDDDTVRYMKLYLHYLSIFWICMTVVIATGYHSSAKFKVSGEHFSVLDYLLVFTSLGPYAVNVLTLISIGELETHANVTLSTISQTSPLSPAFHMSLELLNAIEVYFQVGFCLYAGRILIDSHDTSCRAVVFRGTVLFLAVANGTLWLVGNIAGSGDAPMEFILLHTYFKDVGWKHIRNMSVFFPVSMFHRFICCLQLNKAYLRLS